MQNIKCYHKILLEWCNIAAVALGCWYFIIKHKVSFYDSPLAIWILLIILAIYATKRYVPSLLEFLSTGKVYIYVLIYIKISAGWFYSPTKKSITPLLNSFIYK